MKTKEEEVKNPDEIDQEFDKNKEFPQLVLSTALRLKLSTMNEDFEKLNKDLYGFTTEQESYQNKIKKMDNQFAAEINSHKDPESENPLYKNEFERKLAIEKLANANELYQKNLQMLNDAVKRVDETKAEIGILKFKQRGAIMMAQLEVDRLGFLDKRI